MDKGKAIDLPDPLRVTWGQFIGARLQAYRTPLIVFGIAVAVRLVLLICSVAQIGTDVHFELTWDGRGYVWMARDMLHGTETNIKGLFSHGPGYAGFLATLMLVFGERAVPLLVTQVILSALTCVAVFWLGRRLTENHVVGVVSGLVLALSPTSVSLSLMILSDSLYHLLFAIALVTFVRGLTRVKWKDFILTGVVVGAGILVRPVGQAWPAVLLLMAALYVWVTGARGRVSERPNPWRLVGRTAIAALLAIVMVTPWVIRNQMMYGIPAVAFTTAGGPAVVAARAIGIEEDKPYRQVLQEWIDEYLEANDQEHLPIDEQYRMYRQRTQETLSKHGWRMIQLYAGQVWENVNELNYLDGLLLPHWKHHLDSLRATIKKARLNYLPFLISLAGMIILLWRRDYGAVVILGIVYLYSAVTIGSYDLQGSRYFLPGQTADSILMAVTIVALVRFLRRLSKRVTSVSVGSDA